MEGISDISFHERGFSMLEVLASLTLIALVAAAMLTMQLRAGARIHEVELQAEAVRHFQSARALGQNITSPACGAALATALYLTEHIPDEVCIAVNCDRRSCTGQASWGTRADQTMRITL